MAIAKQDFQQLMTQATAKLVGVSEAAMRAEFYDVLSEFFNDSSCWTDCATFQYQPNVIAYPVSVSEGQIVRLNSVGDWGQTVPPLLTSAIAPGTPSPIPLPSLMPQIGLVVLSNIPNITGYAQAEFTLNCSLPVSGSGVPIAPDWVLPIWHVGLLDGLMGKLMNDPNKSYTNAQGAVYHLKRFRDAIARARVSKLRANTLGSGAWRYPQQFRSLSQQSGVPAMGNASERSF
jgi:hypothetical protein